VVVAAFLLKKECGCRRGSLALLSWAYARGTALLPANPALLRTPVGDLATARTSFSVILTTKLLSGGAAARRRGGAAASGGVLTFQNRIAWCKARDSARCVAPSKG